MVVRFYNIGNSCYLSSTLQCFVNINVINNIINDLLQSQINNQLLYQYLTLLNNNNIANPMQLKQLLCSKNDMFRNRNQQDCHECLIILMDIFHEETKHIKHRELIPYYQSINSENNSKDLNAKVKNANNQWEKYIETFGYSFITHLFTGQFIMTLICNDCETEKSNFESFNNISLDIPKIKKDGQIIVPSVKHCFSKYFKEELLDCDIDCENCKERKQMTKRTSIWRFPNILVLSLKRYLDPRVRNNSPIKLDKTIKFEIQSNKQILIYDLKCVVNHEGYNAQSGHYTTIVQDDEHGYLHIDDNIVRKTNLPEESKAAYILVYVVRN